MVPTRNWYCVLLMTDWGNPMADLPLAGRMERAAEVAAFVDFENIRYSTINYKDALAATGKGHGAKENAPAASGDVVGNRALRPGGAATGSATAQSWITNSPLLRKWR